MVLNFLLHKQINIARKEMILSSGLMKGKLQTLLPVSKNLIAMSCPRYFRSEIEEYVLEEAYDDSEESEILRCFLKVFGSSVNIKVLYIAFMNKMTLYDTGKPALKDLE